MAWRIELLMVPVTEVDRGEAFYVDQVGFNADQDNRVVKQNFRFVGLTPPGWACSIAISEGITEVAPGSLQGIQVVVEDVEATRAALIANSVEVSAIEVSRGGISASSPILTGAAVPCSSFRTAPRASHPNQPTEQT